MLSNLGKRMQAPQARISKPKSEVEAMKNHDKILTELGTRDDPRSPDERPFTRRMRYSAVATIKAVSRTFHI
jgi:hypothetical protein